MCLVNHEKILPTDITFLINLLTESFPEGCFAPNTPNVWMAWPHYLSRLIVKSTCRSFGTLKVCFVFAILLQLYTYYSYLLFIDYSTLSSFVYKLQYVISSLSVSSGPSAHPVVCFLVVHALSSI